MALFVAIDPAVRFPNHYREVESGCWEWTSTIHKDTGYGMFGGRKRNGKPTNVYAHRFSYELNHGAIPPGMQVLHRCDNRKCVNPAHLFLGTQRENIHDMYSKRRARPRGKSPLTPAQVAEIRQAVLNKYGAVTQLAKSFGITAAHVRRIRRGQSFSTHLEQADV